MAAATVVSPALPRPPPPALSSSASSFFGHQPTLGIHVKCSAEWRKCLILRRARVVSCSSSTPGRRGSFRRRGLVLSGMSSSALLMLPNFAMCATTALDEDVKTAVFTDDINAYSFLYPLDLPAKKLVFKWVESRKPERYSSAAPLSPDARQRIVSERVDMINNAVISVSIGPPNPRFLTSTDKSTWNAKDVTDSILADRSTLVCKPSLIAGYMQQHSCFCTGGQIYIGKVTVTKQWDKEKCLGYVLYYIYGFEAAKKRLGVSVESHSCCSPWDGTVCF